MTVDGYMRADFNLAGQLSLQGVDADGAWSYFRKDLIRPLPKSAIEEMQFSTRRLFVRHLDEDARSASMYVGRMELDGVECDRVRIAGTGLGAQCDEYIAADGRLVASCISVDGHETWTRY